METIGFVGLGNIGGAIAINLRKAGFDVLGFDLRPNRDFIAAGGCVATSLDDIAASADVIAHSLPNEAAMIASVDAILRSSPRGGRVVVELSSYPLETKVRQAARLAAAGVAMLDCEISGLPAQAAARQAVIFKSGDAAIIDRLTLLFDAMASTHFNLGPFGAATTMKLIANLMVCVHNLMAAEALNLGRLAGLDPAVMMEVLGPSAAGSTTFRNKAPLMVTRAFAEGRGPFAHMFGYLNRVKDMAGQIGAATPLLDVARKHYAIAERQGRHGDDIAGIIEIIESLNGGVRNDDAA